MLLQALYSLTTVEIKENPIIVVYCKLRSTHNIQTMSCLIANRCIH
jgi:hypothetical protein